MKTPTKIIYLLLIFIINACGFQEEKKLGDFKLLPSPQEFEISGISDLKIDELKLFYSESNDSLPVLGDAFGELNQTDKKSDAQIIFWIDEKLDLPAEGYFLKVQEDQIILTGKDKAGLFYAFKTLEQLAIDAKDQDVHLPICSIKDFPLLAYRSIHLDIKHHLEQTEYYYQLIDKLASYKINAIIAEVEDKIQFERHPKVASADALSKGEWQKLSEYAKNRNIEISPLMQGLGHSSFVLKHEEYKHLRDDPEIDWAYNPLDPETYRVQFDLYEEAIEATPNGKYLHIGGDEVHTTGRGSGKSSLELQLQWLNKVCQFAEDHNRIPIFWDDMPLKHAEVYGPMFDTEITNEEVDKIWEENEHKLVEFLDQFPKNCIYMRWNYHSPETYGNSKAMDWFSDHGFQVMGATAGQTRWVLMPQRESNIDNIKSFALSSIESGLNGLLLTLWDDDSPHFELYMRGILAFSEYTWSGDKRTKGEVKSAYRHREFSDSLSNEQFGFIDLLESPVAQWKNILLEGNSRNYLMSKPEAMEKLVIEMPVANNPGKWSEKYADRIKIAKETIKTTDTIASKIGEMKNLAKRNTYNLEIYEQVNNLVRFSNQALLQLNDYDQTTDNLERKKALERLSELKAQFGALRKEMESTYGKTRILTKPDNYILDQDHHVHLANQSLSFDWQFYAEILFLQKLEKNIIEKVTLSDIKD
ncbi:glycoside hydrolase family 20 zincin-like fold domain-containing protein [Flagellimonas sp. S3867]|uniref:glycoside hydrolase family 20 zincin-like fold domain-containing protein n=1 Tax=Flagellimonas sp. S3867 TaxID=2768063 RepID=UPI0016866107|nr:glycoside hydrolase family 20 zincin-like fold domain-containing protein [Flagellimonas sp. S3867]